MAVDKQVLGDAEASPNFPMLCMLEYGTCTQRTEISIIYFTWQAYSSLAKPFYELLLMIDSVYS